MKKELIESSEQYVRFLEWLEQVFPERLQFPNKSALALGFVSHEEDKK